jgi:hypothetical protein
VNTIGGLDGDDLKIVSFEDKCWRATQKPGMKGNAIRRFTSSAGSGGSEAPRKRARGLSGATCM